MNLRVIIAPFALFGLLGITSNASAQGFTAPTPFDPSQIVLPKSTLPPGTPKRGQIDIRQDYDGVDFLGSNCNCLPPDTNAAVGNNYVVETVNVQIRVFDKTTGIELLNKSLETFFGAPSGGDAYAVYDDTVDRWYVNAFDSTDAGLFLAVSSDGNPTHPFHVYHLTNVGGFPDYAKPGFNLDAIFISYNNYGPGGNNPDSDAGVNIASIDKAAALSGSLRYFVSVPKFQFRAMPPAQIHDDTKGGVEWFVSTDGGLSGNTIRVTKMTNYLSNNPVFTYTSLPVTPYQFAIRADQPGGSLTTDPNTTTYQVHSRKGRLVTAMASAAAADNFVYPKGRVYLINANDDLPAPVLLKEALIDPGPGVAVQMPSVDMDKQGNLGLGWMESSNTEYLSMWVGALYANGRLVSQVAAPGGGFFFVNFRIGDYSTVVLDSDQTTFWAANEYIGTHGASDIWLTHITSFTAKTPVVAQQ